MQKRQNPNQIYQRFLFSLFGTSIMSRIVESKIVKIIVKVGKKNFFFFLKTIFLIAAYWFSATIVFYFAVGS